MPYKRKHIMTAASSGYRREACCLATCLAMEVHLRPLGYSGREQQRWVPQLCVLLPASRYKVRACAQGERLRLRQRDTSVNHVGWKRTRTSFPSAVPGRMRQLTSFDTRPAVERGAAAPPHRHIHHRHGRSHHDGSFQAQCNQQGSHLQPDKGRKHQATFPTMCLVVELHKKAEDFGSQKTYYQKWTPRTCVLARTQTVLSHAKKFVSLQEDCQLTKTYRF